MSGWYVAAALYILAWLTIASLACKIAKMQGKMQGRSGDRWAIFVVLLPWPAWFLYWPLRGSDA